MFKLKFHFRTWTFLKTQRLIVEMILILIRNVLQVPRGPKGDGRSDDEESVND